MPPITQISIPGSNFQQGRAAAIDQITFHHIVGDAPAAISRFQKYGEQVSSTYIIGSDGRIYQCVAERDTPYTDANFSSNSRAITIEHAGGIDSVPYTDAMYAASAKLCASIMSRYNITRFMRHRDVSSVPTACPGALDVERILRQAKGVDEMINDSPQEFSRWTKLHEQIRGRKPTHDEFERAALNRTWLQAMEILSDDPEADAHYSLAHDAITDANALEDGYIGVLKRTSVGDGSAQGWVGTPFRQLIPSLIRSDENKKLIANQAAKDAVIKDLQDQITKAGGVISSKTQAQIDQIASTTQSTNAIVQWIKDFLSKIFK